MNTVVQVKDKKFALYIHEDKIKARVKEVATQIDEDLRKKNPLFLVILNGSFVFAADLLREITIPCEITFVRVASYEGDSSTGEVKQLLGLKENIEGRTVVIVEDIIDSGRTLSHLLEIFKQRNPASIRLCTLLDKPDRRVVESVKVDYSGFNIPDEFVVGYGLDYDQKYRNLPYIGIVKFD